MSIGPSLQRPLHAQYVLQSQGIQPYPHLRDQSIVIESHMPRIRLIISYSAVLKHIDETKSTLTPTIQIPDWMSTSINQGDGIPVIVYAVGPGVVELKLGDRVAALHELGAPGGSFAEYAVAWDYIHLPYPREHLIRRLISISSLKRTEAAALPLRFTTAILGLYYNLRLPPPWKPLHTGTRHSLMIHGASSAVGSFAIKFARALKFHPSIDIAGGDVPFVYTLLDHNKGDAIVDYR
ncbi:MAG: hypothetical protein Q9209_007424 [Squamulea sp. 1 TL-2023]